MAVLGLPVAPTAPSVSSFGPTTAAPAPTPVVGSFAGVLPFANAAAVLEERKAETSKIVDAQQAQPVIAGLSGHIRSFWQRAHQAKLVVEEQLLDAVYARRGEYTSSKLQQIKASNQPVIYMMLAASKMRQVESLLRDVLLGTGSDKPWTLSPTPVPDIPPQVIQQIMQALQMEVQQAIMMGLEPSVEDIRQRMRLVRDQLDVKIKEEARIRCERMEHKMEDQLVEGGYPIAMDQFISDLATFKTAFVKGPVVRNKAKLSWGPAGDLIVSNDLCLHWERVDPFNIYPAPWARHIGEGPLIEKHKLTREDLTQLIGVDGYNEEAIKKVLDEYGRTGLRDWLTIDSQKAAAEGRQQDYAATSEELIDALQYWGSASGQMLLDWGLPAEQIEDRTKEYQIEAWLIGNYVIKAVLNADPLARRPYYAYSFQQVPGNVWGNSPYDLLHDCQDMCNAAARALAANLGIASGPQVAIISNRLPPGEDVTEMFPWKIWQFESDPMGSTADPIKFFQPNSNAAELMQVFEKFSQLADEYTGIPRYMAGFNQSNGGAGRTASGMSMMMGNASKIIKQVVGGIDTHITTPLLERLYYYNMRYSDDPDLKGDAKVLARGAISLQVKESAQVRRNEFLQVTANPIDMQIIGLEGRGEVLRETAKGLNMNTDKVVPPMQVLKERQAMAMMAQAQQQKIAMQKGENEVAQGRAPGAPGSGQETMNGQPTTDNFQPKPQ